MLCPTIDNVKVKIQGKGSNMRLMTSAWVATATTANGSAQLLLSSLTWCWRRPKPFQCPTTMMMSLMKAVVKLALVQEASFKLVPVPVLNKEASIKLVPALIKEVLIKLVPVLIKLVPVLVLIKEAVIKLVPVLIKEALIKLLPVLVLIKEALIKLVPVLIKEEAPVLIKEELIN